MIRRMLSRALLAWILILPLVSSGGEPGAVLMSASPWVGLEPEFESGFKSAVNRVLSGESPFGVYDPSVERAKRRLARRIWKIDQEQAKSANPIARVVNIEEIANKYSEPAKGEVITDLKVTFRLTDGSPFWMVLSADPGTLEVQTMPVTFEEMRAKSEKVLDLYLYRAGADVGLKPQIELGSSHFHISTATAFYKNEVVPVKILGEGGKAAEIVNVNRPIEEQAGVFRDYFVSVFNNPSLAYFGDDLDTFFNAPHPAWNDQLSAKLKRLVQAWDKEPTSVQVLAKRLQDAYVKYSPLDPTKHNPAKYVFYNLTRTANSPSDFAAKDLAHVVIPESFKSEDELAAFMKSSGLEAFYSQTTETRCMGWHKTIRNYMEIIQLYFDRLEYVRKLHATGGGKIAVRAIGSPFSSAHGAAQLAYFVRETYEGLGRTPVEIQARWKTLANLIRRPNVHDAALALDPMELPLKELRAVAYREGPTNLYRNGCAWLFQKTMNLMPDDK